MPGKHAPESPASFFLSLGRAAAGALAVLAVVVLIAVVAVNSRGDDEPAALDTPRVSPTRTAQGGTTPEPSQAAESPAPKPSPTPRPHGQVEAQVLNGNGRTGAAGEASERLEKDGYDMAEPGNTSITQKTTIYFRKGFKADAEALRAAHFDYADPSQVRRIGGSGISSDADVVVVLGRDQPR